MVLNRPPAQLSEPLLRQPSLPRDRNVSGRRYWSKWVTFSCAAVLMVSAGLPYAFSITMAVLCRKRMYTCVHELSYKYIIKNAQEKNAASKWHRLLQLWSHGSGKETGRNRPFCDETKVHVMKL